ncbi:hypothetical protein ABH915_002328 [Arthrobacter sp. MW3 TE3886]
MAALGNEIRYVVIRVDSYFAGWGDRIHPLGVALVAGGFAAAAHDQPVGAVDH